MNHFARGEDFEIEYLDLVNKWAQIVGNRLTERDVRSGAVFGAHV